MRLQGGQESGKFWELDFKKIDRKTGCRKCNWEMLTRDPSELFGLPLSLFTDPGYFIERVLRDTSYRKLWVEDIRYYAACDFQRKGIT